MTHRQLRLYLLVTALGSGAAWANLPPPVPEPAEAAAAETAAPAEAAPTAEAASAPAPATGGNTTALVTGIAHDALFAIAFDGETGIVAGAPGRILHTTDGGRSWSPDKTFPVPLAMLGAALKDGRAIAVGQMGLVFTRNGAAWTKAESPTTERLMNVSLNRQGVAVAVGAFGTLIRSADWGATWQAITIDWTPFLSTDQVEQGIQPHLSAVHVAEDGTITAAGEFSLILRSADAGATWTAAHRGTAAIFALDLRADGAGYAAGQDGTILKTADGGATWTALPPATKANLLGISSAGDRVVVSAMHDMLVSDDGGASWRHVATPDVQAAWYSGVGVGGGNFMAVGHTGRIVRVDL